MVLKKHTLPVGHNDQAQDEPEQLCLHQTHISLHHPLEMHPLVAKSWLPNVLNSG